VHYHGILVKTAQPGRNFFCGKRIAPLVSFLFALRALWYFFALPL
jgi:hypothetical protein